MSVADLSEYISRSSGGSSGNPEQIWLNKLFRVAGAAPNNSVSDTPMSLWRYEGTPGDGAAPTTAVAPDRTTRGAIGQKNAVSGDRYLVAASVVVQNVQGVFCIYDRLLQLGGLSAAVATAQTVGGTITRYTGAEAAGNRIFLEITSILGTTSTTITASYTNEAGTAGRTTTAQTFGGASFREPQVLIELPLQAGDFGVRSVETVTLAGTTFTAGDFAVVIARPIAIIAAGSSVLIGARPFALEGAARKLKPDACLAAYFCTSLAASIETSAMLSFLDIP